MSLLLQLKNSPKWEKCHEKTLEEIYEFATDDEKEILSTMTHCIINCHSDLCDAGGKCDIKSNFHIVLQKKFFVSEVKDFYKQMKKDLPSLESFIAIEESDGNFGIRGEADGRQLEQWLISHVINPEKN